MLKPASLRQNLAQLKPKCPFLTNFRPKIWPRSSAVVLKSASLTQTWQQNLAKSSAVVLKPASPKQIFGQKFGPDQTQLFSNRPPVNKLETKIWPNSTAVVLKPASLRQNLVQLKPKRPFLTQIFGQKFGPDQAQLCSNRPPLDKFWPSLSPSAPFSHKFSAKNLAQIKRSCSQIGLPYTNLATKFGQIKRSCSQTGLPQTNLRQKFGPIQAQLFSNRPPFNEFEIKNWSQFKSRWSQPPEKLRPKFGPDHCICSQAGVP